MLAIYKRELKSYFHSFIGLLFIGVTLFFVGLYFTVYNLWSRYPFFAYTIDSVVFIFMLTVPILCMRIMSEERKSKTDQLILTAPVTVGQIVVGKFLALLTIFAIPTAIICTFPLILDSFGNIPVGEAYITLLAFFLYGMTCIAIGLLASALTESQVIAAVLGFAILFLGYMMNSFCNMISSTGNLLTRIMKCYDLYTPFSSLLNGTLDLTAVVYFLSITVLALFLAVQAVQKRRYSISVKSLSLGAYSSGMIVVAFVITFLVNGFVRELPTAVTSLDLTREKLYSLTDVSVDFVSGLEEDVTIYVLANEEQADEYVDQTIRRYEDLTDHIKVQYVDPTLNPRFHLQYTTGSLARNSVIVVSAERSKAIDANSLYKTSYDTASGTFSTTGYDGEGQITSAIDYVTRNDLHKVYLLTSHEEYTLTATFTDVLTKANIEYEEIDLAARTEVPGDAACIVINAPAKDLTEAERDMILAYLEQGGKVIANTQYVEEGLPNFEAVLAYMGISIADGLVLEDNADNYYNNQYYLLPNQHPVSVYTEDTYGYYTIFAPYAQALILDKNNTDVTYTELLTTSVDAYTKTDLTSTSDYSTSEDSLMGQFPLGVEAVKKTGDKEALMVVFSCANLFTDEANKMVSDGNLMLFASTMGYFAGYEANVSVPVKNYQVSTLVLSDGDIFVVGAFVTAILPIISLVLGFVIWFKRRKA